MCICTITIVHHPTHHFSDILSMWAVWMSEKSLTLTELELTSPGGIRCNLTLANPTIYEIKQAYMAYKLHLNIIAEVYWIKIKTFIHSLFYRLFYRLL